MNIAGDLMRLNDLHQNGRLSDSEFEQAKQLLLNTSSARADSSPSHDVEGFRRFNQSVNEHLAQIEQQNEIAQLDREWQINRQQYLIHRRNGSGRIPTIAGTKTDSIFGGIFGIFWAIGAISIAAAMPMEGPFIVAKLLFPVVAIVVVLASVTGGVEEHRKAVAYDQAFRRYQSRRRQLQGSSLETREEKRSNELPSDMTEMFANLQAAERGKVAAPTFWFEETSAAPLSDFAKAPGA